MSGVQSRPHVVVVGAGIAGLSAAHALLRSAPDLAVTVFEGSPRTGGKLRVGEVAGNPVDLGAEALLNRRAEATGLAQDVGLTDDLVYPGTASAGIWTRGDIRRLPPTLMGIPADLEAAADGGILTREEIGTAAAERGRPAVDLTADVGIGTLVAERLGPAVRDRLVEPLLGGVYAGRADDISLHAAVPQVVDAVRQHRSLLAAADATVAARSAAPQPPAPVFAGIHGGVGRLPIALTRSIERHGAVVRPNTMVRKMARHNDHWQLVVGPVPAAETVEADAVVLAVPAAPAARLLFHDVPAAAAELEGIDYASTAIITLAFDVPAKTATVRGSGFLVPPVDGRQIKAATYSSVKWPWQATGPLLVRCSIGRYGEEWHLQRDDAELVDAALTDLRAATGVTAEVLDSHVQRWGGALPQYTVGHLDRVRRIRAAVANAHGLALCGAAYDGIGVPACIATGQQAAHEVLQQVQTTQSPEVSR